MTENTCYDPDKWKIAIKVHTGDPEKAIIYERTPAQWINDAQAVLKPKKCHVFNGKIPSHLNYNKGGMRYIKEEGKTPLETHSRSVTKIIEVSFGESNIILPQKYYVIVEVFCNERTIMDRPFEFSHSHRMPVFNQEIQKFVITQDNEDRALTMTLMEDPTTQKYNIDGAFLSGSLATITCKSFF